jgi:two-component system, chemotaxis family, protein-glutamate methylesterase/glutaminase
VQAATGLPAILAMAKGAPFQNTGSVPSGRLRSFELVIIVASLGGLQVIKTVLAGLPDTFRLPLLIVLHGMRNESRDRLTWLLQRQTSLPIRTAQQGMSALVPGVTVIPGGFAATINSRHEICLAEARVMGGDDLLASSAAAVGPGAVIAVVLTGMLHDGAAGAGAVKRQGGIVLAQDPSTARAPSMPSSAIATGCVDYVLPPERIAPALISLTTASASVEVLAVPAPPVASAADHHPR